MKVRCIKEFTLAGTLFEKGGEYEMSVGQATDYAEYFEKMKVAPQNKAKKTKVNK